jgi:hypothetical protein
VLDLARRAERGQDRRREIDEERRLLERPNARPGRQDHALGTVVPEIRSASSSADFACVGEYVSAGSIRMSGAVKALGHRSDGVARRGTRALPRPSYRHQPTVSVGPGHPRLARFGLPPMSGPQARRSCSGSRSSRSVVARGHEFEEQRHGLRIERDVADLDHDERDPPQPLELSSRRPDRLAAQSRRTHSCAVAKATRLPYTLVMLAPRRLRRGRPL